MFSSLKVGSIPKGRGEFLVGCADYMWGSGVKGGFVRLFYPIEPPSERFSTADNQPAWMPDKEYAVGMMKYTKFPSWLVGNLFAWLLG